MIEREKEVNYTLILFFLIPSDCCYFFSIVQEFEITEKNSKNNSEELHFRSNKNKTISNIVYFCYI